MMTQVQEGIPITDPNYSASISRQLTEDNSHSLVHFFTSVSDSFSFSDAYIYLHYLLKVRSYFIIMITQEGIPITDPNYYASISHQDFMKVFRSDSDCDIPMVEERIEVMHEAGKALLKVSSFLGSYVRRESE